MGLAEKQIFFQRKKSNTDVIFRPEKNGVSKQKWRGAIKKIQKIVL